MVHGLTTIEIGIRSYLVKSLQQYLKEGFVQSKYLASTINVRKKTVIDILFSLDQWTHIGEELYRYG